MNMLSVRSRAISLGLLVTLLGALPACVSTSDFDRLRSQVYYQDQERRKQEDRIIQLESELARTQPAQANNWAELNAVRSQVAALSGQVDDLHRAQEMQQTAAGGMVTLDAVNAKVRELDYKATYMASQLGIVFDEMPVMQSAAPHDGAVQAPSQAGQTGFPQAAEQPPFQAPAVEATAPVAAVPPQEQAAMPSLSQDLYQKALENFYAKNYKQAQSMWAEFVKGFPQDPLVPNAIFWQGESFFQLQDYANAALTYQKVIEAHKDSNKYKAALLKQGISFYKLNKQQAGKLVLEDLIKQYPDSAEAKRAQAYIKGGN